MAVLLMRRGASRLVLFALLAFATLPVVARADTGVAIDLGSIDINQRLSRGGTYQLPTIGVRNPGTESSEYVMAVSQFEGQLQRVPGSAWFVFSPAAFRLGPGEIQSVQVELRIPTGARPDDYKALLEARLGGQGPGATVGVGAGARVTFTVKPSNIFQAWELKSQTWVSSHSPWSYAVPLAVVLAGLVWVIIRRFEFRVARR